MYFDAVGRYIVEGASSFFTLLHDFKKLGNGYFERFGLSIALALMYGCPGPRNIQESLVCAFWDLPIDAGNKKIFKISIFKPNYKNYQAVLMKIHFKMF